MLKNSAANLGKNHIFNYFTALYGIFIPVFHPISKIFFPDYSKSLSYKPTLIAIGPLNAQSVRLLLPFVFVSFLCGCSPDELDISSNEHPSSSQRFLFMGHTYDHHGGGERVDPRLEELDYSKFDRVILGGDVCSEATQKYTTLEYLDGIFDLGSPNTYYVMGNHDARNGNWDWFQRFTERETYFVHSENGIVSVVLNTTLNPALCRDLNAQFRMLEQVCDTISEASHLMVFHHHAIATRVPGLPDNWSYSNWPYYYWDANCYSPDPSYLSAIYPLLLKVKQRGIEVINVCGDAGFNWKGMDTTSVDGIHYLASGIDNSRYRLDSLALDSAKKDKVLIFEHQVDERSLSWAFHDLDSLVEEHLRSK